MSAHTAEIPPCSTDQLWSAVTSEEQTRFAINKALHDLNGNSDRVERLYQRMFKGRTHMDRRFIAKILRHMFGLKKKDGLITSEPLHPEFPYINGRRYMSREDLLRALKKTRSLVPPTKDQLRRIFDGFARLKLIYNIQLDQPDEHGQLRKQVSHVFDLHVWHRVWEEAARETPLERPKKRKVKTTQATAETAPENHQTCSEEKPENTASFEAAPSGPSTQCYGIHSRVPPVGPGASGLLTLESQSQEGPGKKKIGSSLQEDRSAGASRPSFSVPEEAPASPEGQAAPASPEGKLPRYIEVPGDPYWQMFLTSWVWQSTLKVLNWEEDLYRPDLEGRIAVKPRIPDCLVISEPTPGRQLGVYNLQNHHLPLTPAELELGDFVTRASGCPMRLQDWKLLKRQVAAGLTKAKLSLTLFAACYHRFDSYMSAWRDKPSVGILDVVPELDRSNFGNYSSLLHLAVVDDLAMKVSDSGWLESVLEGEMVDHKDVKHMVRWDFPFLCFSEVNPVALLAPDNAGRMLMAWRHYWRVLVCRLTPEQPFVSNGQVTHRAWAPHQLVRHGIKDQRMDRADVSLDALSDTLTVACETLRAGDCYTRTDLWPAFRTAAKAGITSLPADTRARLTEVALHVYAKTPAHWCDLDSELGAKCMRQLMPLANLDQLRLRAQLRTQAQLQAERVVPYAKFSPAHYIG